METPLTFKARPSNGWLWLALLGIIVLVPMILPFLNGAGAELAASPAFLGPFAIGAVIGAGTLLLAALFPTIRYTLGPDALVLSYGPWKLYRIPYADIKKVSWQDLSPSILSSMRLPGFAMFSVPYGNNVGTVNMCATAMATHILVIRATRALYGITPADEERFVAALMERVKG